MFNTEKRKAMQTNGRKSSPVYVLIVKSEPKMKKEEGDKVGVGWSYSLK
jgi:hypothetical protein